jgi:hypothetical protein
VDCVRLGSGSTKNSAESPQGHCLHSIGGRGAWHDKIAPRFWLPEVRPLDVRDRHLHGRRFHFPPHASVQHGSITVLRVTGRTQKLLVLESATLLGTASTLLTWFVGRGQPCFGPPYSDIIVCPPGLRRGFPLVWVTEVDWPGLCTHGFVCPSVIELTVDWFGLAINLLFWTLLYALPLGLWWDWHVSRHGTVEENS